MSTRIVREVNDLVSGGHTGIVVRGDWETLFADPIDGNTLVSVDAGSPWDLLIHTGDQYGPYDVTTRLLASASGEPGEEWEDVVEVSIRPNAELVVTEMVDNFPAIPLTDEPGDYRLRVHARGRQSVRDYYEDDEPVEDQPIEWYLLEVWPAAWAEPEVLRLTSSYAEATLNPPPALVIPEGEAGLAAARRIGNDVDGSDDARSLSGETGSAHAVRTIRGTRRRLFLLCAHLTSWSHRWVDGASWSFIGGGRGGGDQYAPGIPQWSLSHEHPDQLTGHFGAVEVRFVEVEKPARAVRDWQWLSTTAGRIVGIDKLEPFLPAPTQMTVTLTQSRDAEGEPWTTIQIDHDGLPIEWVQDMTTYWNYQLAIADHAGFGLSQG